MTKLSANYCHIKRHVPQLVLHGKQFAGLRFGCMSLASIPVQFDCLFKSSFVKVERKMKCVTIFGGSSNGCNPVFNDKAKALGLSLASHNIGVVFGSISTGVMGTVAKTVHSNGGLAVGVVPKSYVDKNIEQGKNEPVIGQRVLVDNIYERKLQMMEMCDAFIALPGGIGMLDELTDILALSKLSLMKKPIGILNIDHCFDGFLKWVDDSISVGFTKQSIQDAFIVSDNPDLLLMKLIEMHGKRTEGRTWT